MPPKVKLSSTIISRKNRLHIVGGAHVRKILFEKDKNGVPFAKGVVYVKNDKEFQVLSRKEIILSGGSIGTPQILMLSGVGPQQHLIEIGVNISISGQSVNS